MSTQKYERIYEYIHEYQRLVYDYYSKDVVAFLTTYYSIDTSTTVWDNENLMGGSYDRVGEYSGIKYNKILLLPVYYSEEMTTTFDAQDIGYIKDGDTQFTIPSTYGIVPLPGDKIKLEQEYLRPTNNIYPIYTVKGVEKSTNTDRVFYRLKIGVEQSITETQLDEQVSGLYTFFEYDKKIHTLADAQFMAQLLVKNERLRECIKQNLYDNRSGYYFDHGVGPC
jgi:hypothetical protein